MHSLTKKVSLTLGGLILLSTIGGISVPWILSTQKGTEWICRQVRSKTGLDLQIGTLSLSWMGPQQLLEVHAEQKTEQLRFSCHKITFSAHLWQILLGHDVGHIELTAPSLILSKPFKPSATLTHPPLQVAGMLPDLELSMSMKPLPWKGEITIQEGNIQFEAPGLDLIKFEQLQLHVKMQPHESIQGSLQCVTIQKEGEGHLSLTGSLSELNTSPQLQLQASIQDLPVRGVDQLVGLTFPEYEGAATALLGTTLNADCALQAQWNSSLLLNESNPGSMAFQVDLALSTKTSGSFARKIPFVINTFTLSASSPSLQEKIDWSSSCELKIQDTTGSFSTEGHLTQPLSEHREGILSLKTQQFPLSPFSALSSYLGDKIDLGLSLALNPTGSEVHFFCTSPTLSIPNTTLSLSDSLALSAPLNITYQPPAALLEMDPIHIQIQKGEMPLHHWDQLQLQASLDTERLAFNPPLSHVQLSLLIDTLNHISIQITSDTLTASLKGQCDLDKGLFSLTQPLTAQYTLDLPQLTQKTHLQITVDSLIHSFKDALSTSVKGQIFCPEAMLNTPGQPLELQNTTLPFQWESKTQNLSAQLSSQAKTGGNIQGQINCRPSEKTGTLEIHQALVQGSIHLHNFSSELLDVLSNTTTFNPLVGPSFNADISFKSSPSEHTVSLKWDSPNLNFDSSFLINTTGLRLQSPASVTGKLTPDAYLCLDRLLTKERQPVFGLSKSSPFSLSVTKLFLPISNTPSAPLDLTQLEIIASGTNPQLTFIDKTSNETLFLTDLSTHINKLQGQTPFTLILDSSVSTQKGPSSKSGSLNCQAKIDLPNNQTLSKLNASIQLQAKQFPSRALDLVARAFGRTDFPFSTLLGPTLHLSLTTELKELSGPLQFTLNTPTTQAELSGHLVNGALILDRPFYSQLLISKESSQVLLKEVNPLDLSSIQSQAPVTIQIPEEGFYLPLHPWVPEKVTIPDATIELGKVTCHNEGNVNITLGLLKTRQFGKNQDLTLWFAPLDFSIKQGIVAIDRTEILISDVFDVCLWGNVDLTKDYVDMVLGLTSQTLAQAFGIKGLPDEYVLTIPMKGKMDNVQINTGKATTKVALLLAWQNRDLAGSLGGPLGSFAGELLGAIATLPDAKAKTPPPKHPFPWEIGQEARQPSHHSKKKIFKTSDKPLKQILKVVR